MDKMKLFYIGVTDRTKEIYSAIIQKSDKVELVGVVEESKSKRNYVKNMFKLNDNQVYSSVQNFFQKKIDCDSVIISSNKLINHDILLMAISFGYNILVDAPFAKNLKEYELTYKAALSYNVKVMMLNELRSSFFFRKIKELIKSGIVGDIYSIDYKSALSYDEYSHQFIRNPITKDSYAFLREFVSLDYDLMNWMFDDSVKEIEIDVRKNTYQQVGIPKEHGSKCLVDCDVYDNCKYSVEKIYFNHGKKKSYDFELETHSFDSMYNSLINTSYGDCVYQKNHEIYDFILTTIEFENKSKVLIKNNALENKKSREITVLGSKGKIEGVYEQNEIVVEDFITTDKTMIYPSSNNNAYDFNIEVAFEAFISVLTEEIDYSIKKHFKRNRLIYDVINTL